MNGKRIGALLVIGVLVSAVGGGALWWFLEHYRYQTSEIRDGLAPEARRNPLLAAERFLRRIGVRSESISGRERLLQPPAETGLLLVHHLGPSLSPERQQALLDWVGRGGHLVITAEQAWDEENGSSGNRLLDSLGARLLVIDLEAGDGDPVPIHYPGSAGPLRIGFDPDRILFDRADGEGGYYLLHYPLGMGQVTVLSDNGFLTNDAIGNYDHALLLALLANGQTRAWLLYSSNIPSLPALAWRHAPQLLVSGLLLGLLLTWRLTRRSGPLLAGAASPRSGLREHLQAAAAYLWRSDRAWLLCQASRRSIELAWCQRHPVLETLARRERCQWIAGHTGMKPAEVEQALYGTYREQREFTRLTGLLQRLTPKQRENRS